MAILQACKSGKYSPNRVTDGFLIPSAFANLLLLPASFTASSVLTFGVGNFSMRDMLLMRNSDVNHENHDLPDNNGMSLQERITKLFADQPGKTQAQLARSAGVSRAAVSRWVSGVVKEISSENAFAVGRFFGVNPEWIATGKGRMRIEQPRQIISNASWNGSFDLWDNSTPLSNEEVALPLYKEVEFSAGNGRIASTVETTGPLLRFAKSTLRKQGVPQDAVALAMVSGNSMEPVLPNGSTVGIDTSNTRIIDGKMYAIDHEGHLRIKLLYALPGGGLRIRSHNREEYPDEVFTHEQAAEKIRILGKVFWYSVLT